MVKWQFLRVVEKSRSWNGMPVFVPTMIAELPYDMEEDDLKSFLKRRRELRGLEGYEWRAQMILNCRSGFGPHVKLGRIGEFN